MSCKGVFNTRSVEDILKDYEATRVDDKVVKVGLRTYSYKNKEARDALRKEYIETLDENKQLAIWLHSKLCNNYSVCKFDSEIDKVVDDWSGPEHTKWLDKSDKLLNIIDDINKIKSVVSILNEIS